MEGICYKFSCSINFFFINFCRMGHVKRTVAVVVEETRLESVLQYLAELWLLGTKKCRPDKVLPTDSFRGSKSKWCRQYLL